MPGRGARAAAPAASSAAFLLHVHQFRACAILLIVAYHCGALFRFDPQDYGGQLVDASLRNGTVLFVFIAGFLFRYLSPAFEYGAYLKRKARNVLLPYCVWSLPAVAHDVLLRVPHAYLPAGFHDSGTLYQVLWYLTSGKPVTPYWFVPMVAVFYALAPALLRLDRHPKSYWALVPLLGIATLVGRPTDNLSILQCVVYFLPAYLLGMFASRYESQVLAAARRWKSALWALLGLGTGLEVVARVALGQRHFPLGGGLVVDPALLAKSALCLVLLAILQRASSPLGAWAHTLADLSFGIYFVHWYVILFAREIIHHHTGALEWSPTSHAVAAAAVVLACVLFLAAGKRVLGKGSRPILGC